MDASTENFEAPVQQQQQLAEVSQLAALYEEQQQQLTLANRRFQSGDPSKHIAPSQLQQHQSASPSRPVDSAYGGPRGNPKYNPVVWYLNTDQFREGGRLACPTVSVHQAFYLMYSETPKDSSIIQVLKNGCSDWVASRSPDNLHTYEFATEPMNRNARFARLMKVGEDLRGLQISDKLGDVRDKIPPQFNDPDFGVHLSLRQSLQHLADKVMKEVSPGRARAFVFSRGLLTMCLCARKTRDGKSLRFDIVDSHRRLVTDDRNERDSSAVWIQCYGVEDLLYFMEILFPPIDTDAGLKSLWPRKEKQVVSFLNEKGFPEEHVIEEEQNYSYYTPACLYTIVTLIPTCDTPDQAARELQDSMTTAHPGSKFAVAAPSGPTRIFPASPRAIRVVGGGGPSSSSSSSLYI